MEPIHAEKRAQIVPGYSLNYFIDNEHAVIVDVEVTPTLISKEVNVAETMIEEVPSDKVPDELTLNTCQKPASSSLVNHLTFIKKILMYVSPEI